MTTSVPTLFDLTGRVALVTGTAQGMGRATALALAEAGADLLITDLNGEGLAATQRDIAALGRRVVAAVADVTVVEQVRGLYAQVDREFGRLDIAANIYGPGKIIRPEVIDLEEMHKIVYGLVIARFCSCQEAGRRMLAAGKGSIINICSIGGVTALGRGNFAYSVGMGGVAQMTRELSTEWSGRGVRVNAILPGQVMNPGLTERIHLDPEMGKQMLRGLPIGRFGRPEDIKGLAVFLASDASGWITGALIPMDGGNLAMNAGGTPGGKG
ncbi:MAG: SDR family oxidoreductase [Anaerolineales bacterium]|nr:SDR family oxidoreductase [Anaerolineales bacterium]